MKQLFFEHFLHPMFYFSALSGDLSGSFKIAFLCMKSVRARAGPGRQIKGDFSKGPGRQKRKEYSNDGMLLLVSTGGQQKDKVSKPADKSLTMNLIQSTIYVNVLVKCVFLFSLKLLWIEVFVQFSTLFFVYL